MELLYRYAAPPSIFIPELGAVAFAAVGLCTLNQVDP
jgi:hypothetical protein